DSDGNWYYFGEHLIGKIISSGIYNITWDPQFSEEYFLAYQNQDSDLAKNISLPIKIKTPIFKTFMSIIIPILTRSDIFTSHGQMLMRGMNGIP
ncbi:hypothetical protein LCGC14_2216500, partial [marine sediment metagenome]